MRHPKDGCPCADEIAQRAAVLEHDAHLDRPRAERSAREEQLERVTKRQARQRTMFG
jgi:hypothetical protein